jgi:hypothetical protein
MVKKPVDEIPSLAVSAFRSLQAGHCLCFIEAFSGDFINTRNAETVLLLRLVSVSILQNEI